MGYTSVTGSCEKHNYDNKTIQNYILDCFYILECGRGKSNKKGSKQLSKNKDYKIPLINNIFGCLDKNPYSTVFKKYVDDEPYTLLVGDNDAFYKIPINQINFGEEYFDRFSQLKSIQVIRAEDKEKTVIEINNKRRAEGKKITKFGYYRKGETSGFSGILTGLSVTLELMLLLRFYRFIEKGKVNHIFTKWYVRKSEMFIWLKNENKPLNNIINELDKTECGS